MINIRLLILNIFTPLTKGIGKLHVPFSVKLMDEDDVYAAMPLMKPGMVWLTRNDGQFNNLFIPGFYTHTAMVVDEHHVVEATAKGVEIVGIFEFLMKKDYAMLLTPLFANEAQMAAAAVWGAGQVGAAYDWDFLAPVDYSQQLQPTPVKDRAFYCSKLPWAAYRSVFGDELVFTKRTTLGVQTVVPQDYANAKDKWASVWISQKAPISAKYIKRISTS